MNNIEELKIQELQNEISRLNKIVQSLMNRAERSNCLQGSNFNLFQTAVTLEEQVRLRTTELKDARQETEKMTRTLREKEYQTRLLVENSPVSIHEIDLNGKVTFMNQAGLHMQGLKTQSEVIGRLYLDFVSDNDRQAVSELLADAYTGKTIHFEFAGKSHKKRIYASSLIPILTKDGLLEKLMGITEDITERKTNEEQLRLFAFYDPLTQLPNRRLLNDRLDQALFLSKRNGYYGAVLFLDLDNFKIINDTEGHNIGDLLLIETAQRIKFCLRDVDTVARFGGDEFVVIINDLGSDNKIATEKASLVAEKIRFSLEKPYSLLCKQPDNTESKITQYSTSSIGIVLFPDSNINKENILRLADIAMYNSKIRGKNQTSFHNPLE